MQQLMREESEYIFFKEKNFMLFSGDSLELLKEIESNSVDLIYADPPYFLSNDGITCKSGKMVSVNKAKWDKMDDFQQVHEFNLNWLTECKRALKDTGTIWVSGTYHNIYSVGYALQSLGFDVLNNITWIKTNPPPNLGCRCFTHSNETIIWARKSKDSKHIFNYKLMKEINDNKQMKDVWKIGRPLQKEKKHGSHPTQKPLKLLERIILSSSEPEGLVLDPFNGSGTTGIAAINLDRKYIGIDREEKYLQITVDRYKDNTRQLKLF